MAFVGGHPASTTTFVPGPAQKFAPGASADPDGSMDAAAVIDGTPVRVVIVALSAAAGLYALKLAGFRFNVGVSN